MKRPWPYEISVWRVALGIALGTLAAIVEVSNAIYGRWDFIFAKWAGFVSIPAILLVVLPFVVLSLRRGSLTLGRSLLVGTLLMGLPSFLYVVFVMNNEPGVAPGSIQSYANILISTVRAVLYGVIATAVAWVTAIGFRAEPPCKALKDAP